MPEWNDARFAEASSILCGIAPKLELGVFPTPVEVLEGALGCLLVKRDDLSSPIYGGNKVRVLERLFFDAKKSGAKIVESVGGLGSNHAVASALHAPRLGFVPRSLLFKQPYSKTAEENLRVSLGFSKVQLLPHWSLVPAYRFWHRCGEARYEMSAGGVSVIGVLAYVDAVLELCSQVEHSLVDDSLTIVVPIGSGCTTAGLIAGFAWLRLLGAISSVPTVVAARVTPWPVTSASRVLMLAAAALARLQKATNARWSLADAIGLTSKMLVLDKSAFGAGYGIESSSGQAAIRETPTLALDSVYSGKGFAVALNRLRRGDHVLFWMTKSCAALPDVSALTKERARSAFH